MKKKLNILLTCVGGHFNYDLFLALSSIKKIKLNIYGTDINKNARAKFLKNFFIVPETKKKKEYLKKILSICSKKNINIILPGSEAETILFSENKKLFFKKNIKIPVSDFQIISRIVDKSAMLNYLEKKNINIGKWSILNSNKEMNNIAKIMGYPKKKIVLKPSIGSGSRGVIILDSKIKKFKYLLTNRFCGTGNISCVIKEIKKFKINLKKYICMPHYSGDVYDLDCFAINGKPITVIPRLRVYENPLSPTNQGCIIKKNLKVINYTKKIIRALNLNGPCDFDIVLDRDRKPKLLDSSNRMSGSVGASFVGDLNLPEQIVRHLSGLRLNKIKINKEKHMFPVNKFIKI